MTTICNKCHTETTKVDGVDFCSECKKIVETETTSLPDNYMQRYNPLEDVFRSFGDIFGGQKN